VDHVEVCGHHRKRGTDFTIEIVPMERDYLERKYKFEKRWWSVTGQGVLQKHKESCYIWVMHFTSVIYLISRDQFIDIQSRDVYQIEWRVIP